MKKLFTLTLLLFSIQISFSQLSKWEEDFLRNTDPQGYSYYNFKKGIANQGKQLVQGLTRKLTRYQSLIETQNPDELLADFEAKMQDIKNLEQDYVEKANQFAYNTGQQIGNAINRKDGMAVASGVLGFLEANSAQKQAKKDLEAKKQALKFQREQKMSEIYSKALLFNYKKQEEFLNRAAYAKSEKDEKYNLEFVKNLDCFEKNMKANYNSYSTGWLKNTCAKPVVPVNNTIENMFIAKDVQLRKIAERKYAYYQKTKEAEFREAAIAYAAAAANEKASADNFFLLGKYYETNNPIIALSSLLTVKEINPNYKKLELEKAIKESERDIEFDIKKAIENNDVGYLNSFLGAGLDKLIKVEGKSILSVAIALDQPDAVQTILNSYIKDKPQEVINQKVQKTLMLCALNDSEKTIKRFTDLGVSVDFRIKYYHPIDIAAKSGSSNAFNLLLSLTSQKEVFQKKYGDSISSILALALSNPIEAAKTIDGIDNQEKISSIYSKIKSDLSNSQLLKTLAKSKSLKTELKTDKTTYTKLLRIFAEEVKKSPSESNAALLYSTGVFNFSQIPNYGDLFSEENEDYVDNGDFYQKYALDYLAKKRKEGYKNEKDLKIKKLKQNLERELLQLKEKKLDRGSKLYLNNMLLGYIYSDYQNFVIRKGLALELEKLHEIRKTSTLEKFDILLAAMKKWRDENKDPIKQATFDNQYKQYKELRPKVVKGLGYTDEKSIVDSYFQNAYLRGWPLDPDTINELKTRSRGSNSSDNQSIAYLAFKLENYDLYTLLDKDFDLSKEMSLTGKSIPEEILAMDEMMDRLTNQTELTKMVFIAQKNKQDITKVLEKGIKEKATAKEKKLESFWSEDFNKEFGAKLLNDRFKMMTKKSFVGGTAPKFENRVAKVNRTVNIFKTAKIDPNTVIDEEGNTLLHKTVQELRNDLLDTNYNQGGLWDKGRLYAYERLIALLPLGFDKSIKNKNGETALDIFKKKEKKVLSVMTKNLATHKKNLKKAADKGKKYGMYLTYDPEVKANEVYQAIIKALQ